MRNEESPRQSGREAMTVTRAQKILLAALCITATAVAVAVAIALALGAIGLTVIYLRSLHP